MSSGTIKQLIGLLFLGLGLVVAAALVAVQGNSQSAPSIVGLWLNDDGKAGVDVAPCGAEMCGNIVWLKDPLDPKGKAWTDALNPDTSKRGRAVCGLQIIGGLKPGTNGTWEGGWVYDPEEGKTFNLELSLKEPNTLTVFGYAGIKLLSETMLWKRLPPATARCKA